MDYEDPICPGPAGKPKVLANGVWQVVIGTDKLDKLEETGTLHMVATGPAERRFVLDGELVQR